MSISVYLTRKDQSYDAKGTYTKDSFVVKKGSKIRLDFADNIRGGTKAKSYRNDPKVVNSEGIVLKDCEFGSSSTAAQFVTGRSTNGLKAWHVDKKNTLKAFLADLESNHVNTHKG